MSDTQNDPQVPTDAQRAFQEQLQARMADQLPADETADETETAEETEETTEVDFATAVANAKEAGANTDIHGLETDDAFLVRQIGARGNANFLAVIHPRGLYGISPYNPRGSRFQAAKEVALGGGKRISIAYDGEIYGAREDRLVEKNAIGEMMDGRVFSSEHRRNAKAPSFAATFPDPETGRMRAPQFNPAPLATSVRGDMRITEYGALLAGEAGRQIFETAGTENHAVYAALAFPNDLKVAADGVHTVNGLDVPVGLTALSESGRIYLTAVAGSVAQALDPTFAPSEAADSGAMSTDDLAAFAAGRA